jgi:hypothetical protein
MEKILFKGLQIVSTTLTIIFLCLSYGAYDPVAWAGALSMAIASLMLSFIPEEEF